MVNDGSPGEQPDERRRTRRRTSGWPVFVLAAVLATGLHAVFVALVVLSSVVQLKLPPDEFRKSPPRQVALRGLSNQEWEANRRISSEPREAARASAKPKKKEERPDGQVVDVAPGNDEQAEDAKYLADRNNRVKKQTRAREQTPFYQHALPMTSAPQASKGVEGGVAPVPSTAGNGGTGNENLLKPGGEARAALELPSSAARDRVALRDTESRDALDPQVSNRSGSEKWVGNSGRLNIQPGQPSAELEEGGAGRSGAPGLAALLPSDAALAQIAGGAPNDHLKDVEEGDGTYLNTREFQYASFFNRVKQGVSMHWRPEVELRRRDPTGSIYAGRTRVTMLEVTLDEGGRVRDVRVEKSSGLDFLDLEAVTAFHRAQPFPNPPPGLLASDATVRFQFGFFMEMGGGPRLRLFRSAN